MKIGRNTPCPCGSGRKYKNCCLRVEEGARLAEGPGGPELRRAARRANEWEVDLVPLVIAIGNDPTARPCVVLVVAAGLVLHANMLSRPSPEPEEVASELAREILEVARLLETDPRRIVVRRPEVAAPLSALLGTAGWQVPVDVGSLDDLDEASLSLRSSMAGEPPGSAPIGAPVTWAGWGLPESWCDELFRAAAAFYRAAPWTYLWDADTLEIAAPSGRTWTASVLGRAGDTFGLVLYADPSDVERLANVADSTLEDPFHGLVVSLFFSKRNELPGPMRKEVARAGWEVAGPVAYPHLMTMNALAGGITRSEAGDLVASLAAVTGFAEAHGAALDDCTEELVYRDDGAGAVVRLAPVEGILDLEPLAPGGPEGRGAHPEAALDNPAKEEEDPGAFVEQEMEIVRDFEAALRDEGLSDRTVQRHAGNADYLIQFLAGYQSVPLPALHEYDLRLFLYDWLVRKTAATLTEVRAMPTSLRRFFRYLASSEGLELPWAGDLLADRDLLERRYRTFPGGFWWDSGVNDWQAPLWIDLEARLLVHDHGLGEEDEWAEMMGMVEANLQRELQRRWLLWRDALLHEGVSARPALHTRLIERQRAWETTPQASLDGKSPVEAITEERRRQATAKSAIPDFS